MAGLLLVVLAGCASYGPQGLPLGSSSAAAIEKMGATTGRYALAGGGRRLEFARGPYGRDTFMLDFDAADRLTGWQQVLTEQNFYALTIGMPRDEVLLRIGHPSAMLYLPRQQHWLWSYRYVTPFCIWFQVSIDKNTDRVAELGNNFDPACERAQR